MSRYASLVSICLVAAFAWFSSLGSAVRAEPPSPPTAKQRKSSDLSDLLSAYEQARALLAGDKLDGLAATARRLAGAARKASLAEIARAALPLEKARDLAAARKAFGKLSRSVVALVQADPALKKRLHVFECPMVSAGENQWVQRSAKIENPYMGQRMPACGTKK